MRHRYASPLLKMTDDRILVKQIIELEEGEFKQNYPMADIQYYRQKENVGHSRKKKLHMSHILFKFT